MLAADTGGDDALRAAFDAPEIEGVDLLSLRGALDLKHRIEAAWRARGRVITIRVVGEVRGPGLGVVFGLASDAVNGLPPEIPPDEGVDTP